MKVHSLADAESRRAFQKRVLRDLDVAETLFRRGGPSGIGPHQVGVEQEVRCSPVLFSVPVCSRMGFHSDCVAVSGTKTGGNASKCTSLRPARRIRTGRAARISCVASHKRVHVERYRGEPARAA